MKIATSPPTMKTTILPISSQNKQNNTIPIIYSIVSPLIKTHITFSLFLFYDGYVRYKVLLETSTIVVVARKWAIHDVISFHQENFGI